MLSLAVLLVEGADGKESGSFGENPQGCFHLSGGSASRPASHVREPEARPGPARVLYYLCRFAGDTQPDHADRPRRDLHRAEPRKSCPALRRLRGWRFGRSRVRHARAEGAAGHYLRAYRLWRDESVAPPGTSLWHARTAAMDAACVRGAAPHHARSRKRR